jgi:hypothetical protein
VLRVVALIFLLLPLRAAIPSAASVADQLHQAAFDPDECYRVIELNFSKADLKIYLTSGYLVFAKPIQGVRPAALFSAQVEAGDAEVLLLPPIRSERMSLANFTHSPNLEEHFKTGLMLFTDSTAGDLLAAIQKTGMVRKSPEMGALLSEQGNSTLRNLASSFETRIVRDVLSDDPKSGFFYMGVGGLRLGTFDLIYDPQARDQLIAGQIAYHNNRTFFDTWLSFPVRSHGKIITPKEAPFTLDNYRIDATLQPDLVVTSVTRATLNPRGPLARALSFYISGEMRVTGSSIDGQPAEVFQRESLRENLIRTGSNTEFLVVTPGSLDSSKPHEIEFHHEGAVIGQAGNHVYFVDSRGTWYPRAGLEFSRFDLTFRYPKALELVATGEIVDDRTEGDLRVTRRRSESPIRFAGFNLGEYESISLSQNSYNIRVCANRHLESALQRSEDIPPVRGPSGRRWRGPNEPPSDAVATSPASPNPTARLEQLAREVADELEFMTAEFGPPPIHNLTISPIPGNFGQGFPGLVYLSTLAYLDPSQRPVTARGRTETTFFSELLQAHEVAHQWWGNLVIPAGYQDDWLMEALANYTALLMVEKRKGPKALDDILADYKRDLLAKTQEGRTRESAGPITWGVRLGSSLAPSAWNVITYEKGAWIIHMLRRRLGDEKFIAMLREICQTYRFRTITTQEFKAMVEKFAPPNSNDLKTFFDTWVYGIGIPVVKLNYSFEGQKLTGTLEHSEVPDDFTAFVPVEVQTGREKSVYWLATGSDPAPFSITLKQRPTRVALLSADSLITQK